MNIWTTDLTVSRRIKELIGEQESTFYRGPQGDVTHNHIGPSLYDPTGKSGLTTSDLIKYTPCFTLSELPTVLKKVGEVKEWKERCRCGCSTVNHFKQPSSPLSSEEHFSNCHDCGADWVDAYEFEDGNVIKGWHYHYIKVCELVAIDGDANAYLLELLK